MYFGEDPVQILKYNVGLYLGLNIFRINIGIHFAYSISPELTKKYISEYSSRTVTNMWTALDTTLLFTPACT